MVSKIRKHDLEMIVERINRITNSPLETYVKDAEGKFKAQIGNYHLSWAYGGVCLHRICNDSGGVNVVINSGYTTKRDLYRLMHA